MENVIIALVCISLLVTGALTITSSAFNSLDMLAYAWKDGESSARDMRNTVITAVSSVTNSEGTQVEIVIRNDGHIALANFVKWDVIVVYQGGSVQWLPYTTATPGWTVGGIYLNDKPEVYEPNIVNPMETMKLVLKLSPPAVKKATNLATIATPNGASTEITFVRN